MLFVLLKLFTVSYWFVLARISTQCFLVPMECSAAVSSGYGVFLR